MADITLSERVYIDPDGRATTDPERGAYLWGTPGLVVKQEEAEAVGYRPASEDEKPAAKAVRRPGGTKVVEGPGGTK